MVSVAQPCSPDSDWDSIAVGSVHLMLPCTTPHQDIAIAQFVSSFCR